MKRIRPIIIFIVLLLGMIYFETLPILMFKIDLNKLSENMQILYQFSCDIGFIIIILLIYKDKIFKEFKDYFKHFKSNIKLQLKYYLVGLAIMIISNILINFLVKNAVSGNEDTIRELIKLYPYYMTFSVVLYAPIIEETIFRRSIKDCFMNFKNNKFKKYSYIIISGLIFATLHIIGSANRIIDYVYIIPYMALGSSFAALYYKTDNLWNTIILHGLHNCFALLLFLGLGV